MVKRSATNGHALQSFTAPVKIREGQGTGEAQANQEPISGFAE
jgi:hypothetical protein